MIDPQVVSGGPHGITVGCIESGTSSSVCRSPWHLTAARDSPTSGSFCLLFRRASREHGLQPPIWAATNWTYLGLKCQKSKSGSWFGTWLLFSHILGIIIQTDFHIFQRGWHHQKYIAARGVLGPTRNGLCISIPKNSQVVIHACFFSGRVEVSAEKSFISLESRADQPKRSAYIILYINIYIHILIYIY